MRRLKIIHQIFKNFRFVSAFVALSILVKRKLGIQDLNKQHLVKMNYGGRVLQFWVKENDGLLAILDTFSLGIYDNDVCKNNKVIFDCGAHIGTSAVFFSLMNPLAKIYCFEPDESSFKLLKQNLMINCVNAEAYNYAISDQDGLVNFNSSLNCSVSSIISKSGENEIQAKRIDTLMEELKIDKIDLLKLDIEGEEFKVISDLKDGERIQNLTCEVHHQCYAQYDLIDALNKKGFMIIPDAEKEKYNSLFASRVVTIV